MYVQFESKSMSDMEDFFFIYEMYNKYKTNDSQLVNFSLYIFWLSQM